MKVALQLFHGRGDPEQQMDGWGTQGPVFLLNYVHVTYGADIKLGIATPAGDGDLKQVGDCLYYDGVYYGDWSVFPAALLDREPELARRVVPFDARKARPAAPTVAAPQSPS